MKSKFLSCLAVAVVAAVMGQGTYAIPSIAPFDINAQDIIGDTALNRAVKARDLAEVNRLLDAGADWSITNMYDEPPLHYAVMDCNAAIVRSLLDHGANVNQITDGGLTPLDVLDLYVLDLPMNPAAHAIALNIRAMLLNEGGVRSDNLHDMQRQQ